MIKYYIACVLFFFVFSCSNIEFVLENNSQTNPLKNKTILLINKNVDERFARELYAFFGNKDVYEYILEVKFLEKKENKVIKNNQVAEKIKYSLEVDYGLFYKSNECKIYEKKVVSNFTFTPKSAGYNFGSDRAFDNLYENSITQNINNFVGNLLINKSCLE